MLRALVAAILLVAPMATQAHLLPAGQATLRIKDNAAFLVVSVPVNAFSGVDQNGDGLLDPEEVAQGNATIQRQFSDGVKLSSGGQEGVAVLTMVSLPDGQSDLAPSDYLVVMQRIDFAAMPGPVLIDMPFLRGEATTMRASSGEAQEVAVLAANDPQHLFFAPSQ